METVQTRFDRDGFAVVRDFVSTAELATLNRELQRYRSTVVPSLPDTHAFYVDRSRPETLKQLQQMEGDSFFAEYSRHPAWTELATLLLGESVKVRGCEWFNKPPNAPTPTPPHQDNAYFNLVPCRVLTMWLALEEINSENGCLRYVRASHLEGRRPHHRSGILGFSQELADFGPADEERTVAVELAPGDLVVHHGWTVHSADANHSCRHRPAFAMVFEGQSCQVDQAGLETYRNGLNEQHASLGVDRSGN